MFQLIKYRDINRDSQVWAYEFGQDYIAVQFKNDSVYLYTYQSAGSELVEQMKALAEKGDGLNSYILRKKVRYERNFATLEEYALGK